MCDGHGRASLRDTIANLRQPMPLGRKLRLFLQNIWVRISTGSRCCGNFGQPGC